MPWAKEGKIELLIPIEREGERERELVCAFINRDTFNHEN